MIIGLIVANVVQPGAGMHIDPSSLDPKAVANYAEKAHEQTITGFLSNIIPTTIVGAFASGDILQVLFFSVLFGISLAMVGDKGKPVTDFLQMLTAPVFKLVSILMKAAPIGAFGAMAFTIGKYGIGSIANLALLIATFYITALLFVLIVLGAVARYNGFSIRHLFATSKKSSCWCLALHRQKLLCQASWTRWKKRAVSARSWALSFQLAIRSTLMARIST